MSYTANIIPAMTSATAPSGTASASSQNSSTYAAWKAFNHTGASFWLSATLQFPYWLAYAFPATHIVTQYTITARPGAEAPPTAWTFEGYNGSTWDVLDTRSGVVAWAAGEKKTYSVANSTSYTNYRVNISAGVAATYVGIAELEMMETVVGTVPLAAIGTIALGGSADLTGFFAVVGMEADGGISLAGYADLLGFGGEVASSLTIQPNQTAGKDALIYSLDSGTNFGSTVDLQTGDTSGAGSYSRRFLLAFDVSGVPAGATINAVTLSLWEDDASRSGGVFSWDVEMRRVLRNWVEAQVTFNSYSTGNNWATAGCGNATDRVDSISAVLTLDAAAAEGFVDWTGAGLVADVQAWVDGSASNYGWLFTAPLAEYQGTSPYGYSLFCSSDNAYTDRRPKIVITYTEGVAARLDAIGTIELAGAADLTGFFAVVSMAASGTIDIDGIARFASAAPTYIAAIGTVALDGYADLCQWEPMVAVGSISLDGEAWLTTVLHGEDTLQAIGTIALRVTAVRLSTGETLPPTDDLGWTEP